MFLVSSCSSICPILWSHVLCREWKYISSSADTNYTWVINNFIVFLSATYIADSAVHGIPYTILCHDKDITYVMPCRDTIIHILYQSRYIKSCYANVMLCWAQAACHAYDAIRQLYATMRYETASWPHSQYNSGFANVNRTHIFQGCFIGTVAATILKNMCK